MSSEMRRSSADDKKEGWALLPSVITFWGGFGSGVLAAK
jgi:hypothetical protein